MAARPDLGVWEPFAVATVLQLMQGAEVAWWLSGGEALDAFVGRKTRPHGDIDISLRRSDLARFREHIGSRLELQIAHDGALSPLTDAPPAEVHGLWARDERNGPWRLQINLEPVENGEWIYRREPRVRLPLERVVRRRGALPYVSPAVQLLWKAKDTRAQDEHDFDTIAPLLNGEERRWLADAITRCHPQSAWPARLAGCA
jgi:Aminoglycoside-2''-adenylyltransferase